MPKNKQQIQQSLKQGLIEIHNDWEKLLAQDSSSSDPHFLKKVATDIQNLDRDAAQAESIEILKDKADIVRFVLSTPWGAPFVDNTTLIDAANNFSEDAPESDLSRLLSRFATYGHQMETPIFQVFDEIVHELEAEEK